MFGTLPEERRHFVEEVANEGLSESPTALPDSALKAKAAHDNLMDRIAQLATNADEFELGALAKAFADTLTVFKPKVVWE